MSVETTAIVDGKYKVLNPDSHWIAEKQYESIEKSISEIEKGTLRFIDGKIFFIKYCRLIEKRRKFLFFYEKSYKVTWEELNFNLLKNNSLRKLIEIEISTDKDKEKFLKLKKELEMEKENDKKS